MHKNIWGIWWPQRAVQLAYALSIAVFLSKARESSSGSYEVEKPPILKNF